MKFLQRYLHTTSYIPLLVGVVCVVLTNLPIFQSGFFRPHDFTHAARIVEMNRSLSDGEFPVRWSENFGFGYGMPLFHFYAPLPYYLAQLPYFLTGDALLSIRFLYVLNGVLAFGGMYLFASKFWKESSGAAALLSAVFFSLSTYRALDLFVRGAIGEVFAMVLLPFALYGLLAMDSKKTRGILVAAVSLAAVLLSHNLIGMLSLPLFLFFGFIRTRQPGATLLSLMLAIGLSAFYTLPAYFEKGYTRVEQTITGGYFDFHNHFVALRQFFVGSWGYGGSVPGLEDGMSFALGIIPLSAAVLAVVGYFYKQDRVRDVGKMAAILFPLIGSLFLASNRSVFVWERLEILKFLQFPWRFLTFSHIFLSLLAGGSTLLFKKSVRIALFSSICLLGIVVMQVRFFQPEVTLADVSQYYSTSPEFIKTQLSKTLNDYLPPSIENDNFPSVAFEKVHISRGEGSLSNLTLRSNRINFQSSCQGDCLIEIALFEFPGWESFIDGRSAEMAIGKHFPTYELTAPDGVHTISVELRDTPVRVLGNILSMISMGICLTVYIKSERQKKIL